jgi:hypothetical protein
MTGTAQYRYTRRCPNNSSCCGLRIDMFISYRATDFTNFNVGVGHGVVIPGTEMYIPDEMFVECYKNHADFHILAIDDDSVTFFGSCRN